MYKFYNKQLLVGCTTGAQLRLQRSVDKDVAGRHKTIAQPKSHWWGAKARPLGTVKRLLLNFWETFELLEFAIVFVDHSMLTAGKYLYILLCLVMHLPFACGLCPLSSSSPMPTLFGIVSWTIIKPDQTCSNPHSEQEIATWYNRGSSTAIQNNPKQSFHIFV